jgi:hypothetical protein
MHQHGIVFAVVQEPGGHESRTDVCKPDGKFLDVSQLLQRIDVRVLETFGWVNALVEFYAAGDILGLSSYSNVQAWLERGLARPAVQRGLRIPARPA